MQRSSGLLSNLHLQLPEVLTLVCVGVVLHGHFRLLGKSGKTAFFFFSFLLLVLKVERTLNDLMDALKKYCKLPNSELLYTSPFLQTRPRLTFL